MENSNSFSIHDYVGIIEGMAAQPEVRAAVLNSYEDNPWWPKSIQDWRVRMIVAGLSTRVGFRMLGAYRRVVERLAGFSFEDIQLIEDEELLLVIKPLGLANNRLKFIRSMVQFLVKESIDIESIDEDLLVRLIHENVEGASYKIGACCVLYAKHYNCGIIPIDSGIKDNLAPCIGLSSKKNAEGHEVVRYQFEEIANQYDWKEVANRTGYSDLDLPTTEALTWWLHLVVINFKRHFCNNKKPEQCPLKGLSEISHKIGSMCSRETPRVGGYKFILVDGEASLAKTLLLENLSVYGVKPLSNTFVDGCQYFNDSNYGEDIRHVIDSSFLHNYICHSDLIDKMEKNHRVAEELQYIAQNNGRVIFLTDGGGEARDFISMYRGDCDIEVIDTSMLERLEVLKVVMSPKEVSLLTQSDVGVRLPVSKRGG